MVRRVNGSRRRPFICRLFSAFGHTFAGDHVLLPGSQFPGLLFLHQPKGKTLNPAGTIFFIHQKLTLITGHRKVLPNKSYTMKNFHFKLALVCILLLTVLGVSAQDLKSVFPVKNYRETAPKTNDLVHTKLNVRFDYQKSHLLGQAWLTLKPHQYPTDTLRLDAKGMLLGEVAIVKNNKLLPLHFTYDSLTLIIKLDRVYNSQENYTVYIAYTARPNEIKGLEYAERGLYFVNPDGKEKNVPKE